MGDDEEMGYESRAENVGPYQFVWPDGEDYFDGEYQEDADKTDIPMTSISNNKVGRPSLEDEQNNPLIPKESYQVKSQKGQNGKLRPLGGELSQQEIERRQ